VAEAPVKTDEFYPSRKLTFADQYGTRKVGQTPPPHTHRWMDSVEEDEKNWS
jgi:hypothetical protein